MKNNTKTISNLVALWYDVVNLDHHKDRDCHFAVGTRFSYNGQMKHFVEHHGYVIHNRQDIEEFDSIEDAENSLIKLLDENIRKRLKFASEDEFLREADYDGMMSRLYECHTKEL